MNQPDRWRPSRLILAACAALAAPTALTAQGGPGFLFRQPVVSIGVRAGYSVPSLRSDVFDFTRDELTLSRADYHAPLVGFDVAVRVTERFDLAAGYTFAESDARSEFRDWVDTNDLPIEQTTRLKRQALTFSGRWFLRDRGRSVGRFSWIPTKWAPFVGGGAGWIWHRFEQEGDFVDFETLDVFPEVLISSGTAPVMHVLSGVEISVAPNFVLIGEGRYSWANDDMSRDFVGFENIDLGGFQATAGVAIRF